MSEKSPYWNWVRRNMKADDVGHYKELPEANPDVLSDDSSYWNLDEEEHAANRKKMLEKFAVLFETLTEKQKEVILALDQFGTQKEAAKNLGIKQSDVSKILKKVQEKLLQLGIFDPPEGIL